jgi:hypothetical protein
MVSITAADSARRRNAKPGSIYMFPVQLSRRRIVAAYSSCGE